jgi:hypothetical protein
MRRRRPRVRIRKIRQTLLAEHEVKMKNISDTRSGQPSPHAIAASHAHRHTPDKLRP